MGYACAQAVLLLSILILATYIQKELQKKWVFYE